MPRKIVNYISRDSLHVTLVDFKAQTYPFTIVVTGHKVGPDPLSPAGLQSDIVPLDIAVTTWFGTVPV